MKIIKSLFVKIFLSLTLFYSVPIVPIWPFTKQVTSDVQSSEPAVDQKQLDQNLYTACSYGDADQVKKLLAQGANANYLGQYAVFSCLEAATSGTTNPENRATIITMLTAAGINANTQNIYGYSALHYAKHPLVIAALIQAGANKNARDYYGNTPLHKHVEERNKQAVKALIQHGADIDAYNDCGQTPLYLALGGGFFHRVPQYKIVKFLTKQQASIEYCARDKRSLDIALLPKNLRSNDAWKIIRLLCEKGVDLHQSTIVETKFKEYKIKIKHGILATKFFKQIFDEKQQVKNELKKNPQFTASTIKSYPRATRPLVHFMLARVEEIALRKGHKEQLSEAICQEIVQQDQELKKFYDILIYIVTR